MFNLSKLPTLIQGQSPCSEWNARLCARVSIVVCTSQRTNRRSWQEFWFQFFLPATAAAAHPISLGMSIKPTGNVAIVANTPVGLWVVHHIFDQPRISKIDTIYPQAQFRRNSNQLLVEFIEMIRAHLLSIKIPTMNQYSACRLFVDYWAFK